VQELGQTHREEDQPVVLFPVPANDQVFLSGARLDSEMTVVDIQGRVQMKSKIVSSSDQIDISGLQAGVYHAIIINQKGVLESRKLVVVK
jgi:hypothetical protein